MEILRIQAVWSGFTGSPGYSAFHFTTSGGFFDGGLFGDEAQSAADSAAARVSAAFFDLRSSLPTGMSVRIDSEAAVLDSDTGEILGALNVEAPTAQGINPNASYSGPSGGVVNWRTNDYRFGRRIRGRTFLVPLSLAAYDGSGTLSGTALGHLRDFADTMISGGSDPEFGVWSRPKNGAGGVFASVVSASVPDLAAVLRSRRD